MVTVSVDGRVSLLLRKDGVIGRNTSGPSPRPSRTLGSKPSQLQKRQVNQVKPDRTQALTITVPSIDTFFPSSSKLASCTWARDVGRVLSTNQL